MRPRNRYPRDAAHDLGERILAAIGDDTYEEAAAKVQLAGGQVSAPGLHKWVTKPGNITEPNVLAFCAAYSVRPAWLRYGVPPKSATECDQPGLVESLPNGMKQEALDFLGYLVERRGGDLLGERMPRYLSWIEAIGQDMKRRRSTEK